MPDDDENTTPDLGQDQFTALQPLIHTEERVASMPVTDPFGPGAAAIPVSPLPRKQRVSPYHRPDDDTADDDA